MAAVLSFFVPGLGHIYAGHIFQGLFFFVLVPVLYALAVFTMGAGLLLAVPVHLFVMIDAKRAADRREDNRMSRLADKMRR